MAKLRVGIIVLSLLSLISGGPALANVSIPSSQVLPDISYLYISENTTWYAASSPYILEENVTVASDVTLTIEPGVVVKFGEHRRLDVDGTLVADADGGDRIYFTSIKDDTVGGDDNNDGGTTSPAEKDWEWILFHSGSTGNVLNNVFVGYGGWGNNNNILVETTSLTVTDSTIAYGPTGIYYNVGSASGAINVSGNEFLDNSSYAVYVYLYNHSADISLSGNTATNNGRNGVRLNGSVTGTVTFDGDPNLPFVIDSYLDIGGEASLTLAPGAIVKFISTAGDMDIWGTLVADAGGGDRIYFTSIKDDSIGGDTNNDGTDTSPEVNDWEWIHFQSGSTGNVLNNVFVGYGGWGNGYNVRSNTSSLTISDSSIGHGNTGIYVDNASPNIVDNIISVNSGRGIDLYNASPDVVGNTITDNDYGIYTRNGANPIINGNQIQANTEYGVYNNDNSLTIDARDNWWGEIPVPMTPRMIPPREAGIIRMVSGTR
jgi:parallel beta-helix repeat protein